MAITAQSSPTWIRSWETSTSIGASQGELEALIRRYGATGYTLSTDYTTRNAVLSFTLPRSWQVKSDEQLEIRLTVAVGETQRRLEAMEQFRRKQVARGSVWADAQAERVAWRHALMFVQAGLEAAAAGVQTLEEAFFAHVVLPGPSKRRVIDYVHDETIAGARRLRA